jgi:tRNA A37 threonylcarbamoyltransferase TsaD
MIHMPVVPGGGYTLNQCVLLAALADKELGDKWEARFVTVNHVTGRGHCSLKRVKENEHE